MDILSLFNSLGSEGIPVAGSASVVGVPATTPVSQPPLAAFARPVPDATPIARTQFRPTAGGAQVGSGQLQAGAEGKGSGKSSGSGITQFALKQTQLAGSAGITAPGTNSAAHGQRALQGLAAAGAGISAGLAASAAGASVGSAIGTGALAAIMNIL